MKNQLVKNNYILILIAITISLLAFMILHAFGLSTDLTIIQIPFHSSIEAIGGIMTIIIAILLFVRFHDEKDETHYSFVAMGFFGDGHIRPHPFLSCSQETLLFFHIRCRSSMVDFGLHCFFFHNK